MKLHSVWVLFSSKNHKIYISRRFILTLVFTLELVRASFFSLLSAEVFYAQDEALKLAFPEADKVEQESFVLDEKSALRVEELSQTKLDSKLFTFYKAYKAGNLLGYIVIDSHTVRSMQETFMLVLSPDGKQERVVMLAFYEPAEYLASQKWLDQFNNKELSDNLIPGRGVHGIAGSTLTSNAMAAGIRKGLAMYQVIIKEKME